MSINFVERSLHLYLLVAIFACGASATSITSVTVDYSSSFSNEPGSVNDTFEGSTNLPDNMQGSGTFGVVAYGKSVKDQYLAPTNDNSNYGYVGAYSSLTYAFAAAATYFSLYWGSPDVYNTLMFTDVDGYTVSFAPGAGALAALIADQKTAAYVSFSDSGAAWKSVTLASSGPAFEFDNVSAETPQAAEPSTVILFCMGLFLILTARRRRLGI